MHNLEDLLDSSLSQDEIDSMFDVIAFLQVDPEDDGRQEFADVAIAALAEGAEVDFLEKVIYAPSLKSCVKDIIKKMYNDDQYVDLGDMPNIVKEQLNLTGQILDVFKHSDKYNIVYENKRLPLNNAGQKRNVATTPRFDAANQQINFTIAIDNDYVKNATDLALARTLIHESLHAYISYVYQDQPFTTELSLSLRKLLSEVNANPNSAQHKLMSINFVNAIASSLEVWDDSALTDDNYYEYISWSGGLISSPAFSELDSIKQQNIMDANRYEGNALLPYDAIKAKGSKNCQ